MGSVSFMFDTLLGSMPQPSLGDCSPLTPSRKVGVFFTVDITCEMLPLLQNSSLLIFISHGIISNK